ncbi:hypothetical protein BG005_001071 [Podila minutissima]|nr:hypothetical protein BG005_001071 [Podila minutissima]
MTINREKMSTPELEQVQAFHRNRIRGLLLKSSPIYSSDISSKEPLALAPELMMTITEHSPPRTWSTLCRLNKDWASIVLPFIWRTVSNSRSAPAMKKHARLIRSLDLNFTYDTDQFGVFKEIMVNNLEVELFAGLRKLKLDGYEISRSSLHSILTRLPNLRALDIKDIILRDRSLISQPSSILHLLSDLQQLESLSLNIEARDLPGAASQGDLRPLSNLMELRLHCGSVVSFLDLPLIPAQLPRLRVLDIWNVTFSQPTLTDILISTGHELQELVLSHLLIKAEDSARFGPYLDNLHKLDLSRPLFGQRDIDVAAVIQHCHTLRELTINANSSMSVWETVARTCPELQALSAVCSSGLSGMPPKAFIVLQEGCKKLRRLKTGHYLTRLRCLQYAKVWGSFQGLEELSLRCGWRLEAFQDTGMSLDMRAIFCGLSALTGLRVLEFYNVENSVLHVVSSEALRLLGTLTRLERLCLLRCRSWVFEDLRWVLETFPRLDEFEFSKRDVSIPDHGWLVANAGGIRLIATEFTSADMPRASSHVAGEDTLQTTMEEQTTMSARTSSHVQEEEGQTSSGKATMTSATSGLQSFKPLKGICQSFCGLHMYPNDPKRQVIAYHYCHSLDADRYQCLMYDSNTPEAKLMGIEYIISETLFNTLDANEKKYWHSHKYEVESGMLVQVTKPLVTEMLARHVEHAPLKTLVNTYGKIWQLWPVDNEGNCSAHVPTGPAQLLMGFTEDGQVNPALLEKRDKDLGISTEEKRRERIDIKGNPVAPGADQALRGGKAWQVVDLGDMGALASEE